MPQVGVKPNSAFGNLAQGLHASVDLEETLGVTGATLSIELQEYTGGANNNARRSVQIYTNMDGAPPCSRQEMMRLWWHQSLMTD